MSKVTPIIDPVSYVNEAKEEAIQAFEFLKETGTLSASWTFNVSHRIPGHDLLLSVSFPRPWEKTRTVNIRTSSYSQRKDFVLHEDRLDADTYIHAHTPYLAAWSLAHQEFPIRYVAAQRHLLTRVIPNHLDRTRSVLDVIRERLDQHPEWAPPTGILESNGGANFWGRGILKTAQLILFIEEAARFQAIAEQIGGAKDYNPGTLDQQWQRTGLLERARSAGYVR
jgi:L-ribulose-5-phosphate 4-epimerase